MNCRNKKLFPNFPIVGVSALCMASINPVFAENTEEVIRHSLAKDYPGAVIQEIEWNGEHYEVDFVHENEQLEATYNQNAMLLSVQNEDFSSSDFFLGAVITNESTLYRGTDRETEIYPYIHYDNGTFYFQGASLGYRIYKGSFDIAAQLDVELGEGYDKEDSSYFDGMDELDTPIHLGLVVEKEMSYVDVEFSLMADVAGTHKGIVSSLGVSHEIELGNEWELELGIEAIWHDAKYNDYFYGVDPKFVRTDRPVYRADGGVDTAFEIGLQGRLWGNWYMLSEFEYVHFSSEVKDSPLTEKDSQSSISVGIGYAF